MAADKSTLRIHAEYLAVRGVLAFFQRLPVRAAFWLSDRLADLVWRVDRQHREVALGNLARVYGGAPADHMPLARRTFRSFVRVGVEFALLPRLIRERGLPAVLTVTGRENLDAVLSGGRGAIVYSAHIGNWESIAAAGESIGLRYHAVGRAMDNPLLDRFLARRRGEYALSVIPKDGALPRVARLLRSGENVVMLMDQHAGRAGLWLDFLGSPASTFRGPAELAVRFGVPMIGAFGIRVDPAPRFELEFLPPLRPDPSAPREAEVERLTRRINEDIAARVLRHPEQWNWLHRRWRRPKKTKRSGPAPGVEVAP